MAATKRSLPADIQQQIAIEYGKVQNKSMVARKYDVSVASVTRAINKFPDIVESAKKANKRSINDAISGIKSDVSKAMKTIDTYYDAILRKGKISNASARDCAMVIGTITDKLIRLHELDLREKELEIRNKEASALSKGVVIKISPDIKDFSKDGENNE